MRDRCRQEAFRPRAWLIFDVSQKMKIVLALLLTAVLAHASEPVTLRVVPFTYHGVAYENRGVPQEEIDRSPPWRYEDGEPPVRVTEAHALALQWVRNEFGPAFKGTAYSCVLSFQKMNGVSHGFWTVVFTEEGESIDAARKLPSGSTFAPAHVHVAVLLTDG